VAQLLHSLFPNSEGKSDAVVPIQAEVWRPDPHGNPAGPDVPFRTEPRRLHRHGGE
jgi:hypothetical protein